MPQRQKLDEILAAARKLPLEARAELAELLVRADEAPGGASTKQQTLTLLVGMTDTELCTLAGAMVAPGRQRRMKALLRKISLGETLGGAQQRELDALLEEADRIALLKARRPIRSLSAPDNARPLLDRFPHSRSAPQARPRP